MSPTPTTDPAPRSPKPQTELSTDAKTYSEVQKKGESVLPGQDTRMVDEKKLLEERLQRLEREITHRQASSNLKSSAGRLKKSLKIHKAGQ